LHKNYEQEKIILKDEHANLISKLKYENKNLEQTNLISKLEYKNRNLEEKVRFFFKENYHFLDLTRESARKGRVSDQATLHPSDFWTNQYSLHRIPTRSKGFYVLCGLSQK
jgi:hypothetical protein